MTPKELKNSILQLAIEGKLVEQRKEEGSAETLYAEIQKEKQKLIKQGKIKKEKELPEITEDEIPFEIPKSWRWCRFQEVFFVHSAMRIHQSDWKTEGVPFLRGRELVKLSKTGDPEAEVYISEEFYNELKTKGGIPKKNDILISAVGTLGKVYVVKGTKKFYYKDAYILCLDNYGVNPFYIKYLIEAPFSQNYIYGDDAYGTTVAQLTLEKLKRMLLPLPSIGEQKCIVEKIEELMPLVDRYEVLYNRFKELNKEFPKKLKNAVLQKAIEGKLVKQIKSEGNAEDLYKEIQKEKQKLIKQGKIKKEKPLSEITEDEVPFEIPKNWKWVRIGECINNRTGLSYKKENLNKKSKEMVRVLRGGNILDLNYIFNENDILISKEFVEDDLYLKKNVLITPAVTSLEHIGKMCRIDKNYNNVVVGGFVLELQLFFNNDIMSKYFLYAFGSTCIRDKMRGITNKSGQAFYNLSREKLMNICMPLPSLAEQKRIVEKIEEILPNIEKLEKYN